MQRLRGLIAATFTPMEKNGAIAPHLIPGMVEALLQRNISGLYVCGSTGEGPSLNTEERETVARAFVEAVQGRVPVVVQVGHNSLEEARRLARHAAAIRADAISAVSPSYFLPENAQALVDTMAQIADAAPQLPFYYYHIPRFTGLSIGLPSFLHLATRQIPSLAGVKFSCRDIEIMQQCIAAEDGRFNILFGVDEMLMSGWLAGCDGAVGSTYNFWAPLYLQMIHLLQDGEMDAARDMQLQAARMIDVIVRCHGVSGLKAAMSLAGVPCGPPRLPLTPLTDAELGHMREDLAALGFFDCIGSTSS